jgi:hypothetical protein
MNANGQEAVGEGVVSHFTYRTHYQATWIARGSLREQCDLLAAGLRIRNPQVNI